MTTPTPTPAPSSTRPRLAALDGFRGLFASLVVLFHFGVTSLVGGWIGLNHFFVFSGYLIASLLITERVRTGTVSAIRFYGRRARRLIPALLVVTSAVLLHAWFAAGGSIRRRDSGDVLATLGWMMNWRLVARGDDYFEAVGDPSPLRHAWTLAVEEQFYVLVPFIVLGLFLLRTRKQRMLIVAAAAVVLALWSARLADSGASFARLYYGTDTRAQALLVGVLLALFLTSQSAGTRRRRLPLGTVKALGLFGFVLSAVPFVVVSPESSWLFTSGGMLLFAVAAALMGLAATDPREMTLTRLASWRPLVLIGERTYGVYLYHWPVHLWLGPALTSLPLGVSVAVKFAVTVALAWLSFRFLEVPVMRDGFAVLWPRMTRRAWRWPALAGGLVAVAALALWRAPVPIDDLDVPALVASDRPFRAPADPVRFALIGDSVGASLSEGWAATAYPGVTMTNLSRIGCDLIDAPMVQAGQSLAVDPTCGPWRAGWLADAQRAGASEIVVLSGLQFLGPHLVAGAVVEPRTEAAAQLIRATLTSIAEKSGAAGVHRVTVVTQVCRRVDPSRLDPRLAAFAAPASDPANVAWANEVVRAWVAQGPAPGSTGTAPARRLLDLWDPLCANGFQSSMQDVPLYHDSVHFSPAGAAMVWTWLVPRIIEGSTP